MKTIFDYKSESTDYFTEDKNFDFKSDYKSKEKIDLPSMAEVDVVRHYTNLSRKNFGVDTGFYPLGSCTMKYNPRLNESLVNNPEILNIHPLVPETKVQGFLEILYNFEQILLELSGMDRVSFQPAAGAHGEVTSIFLAKAYFKDKNEPNRTKIIVPDSSHGTNPATSALAGFQVKQIKSTSEGLVDLEALRKECDETTAAFMLTNPNTLGLFDKNILEIADIVHKAGALLFYDGANFNALMGLVRPGDMNFDMMQFNLHKTFSTPHGGGGPGAGPVAVKQFLADYLPYPLVEKKEDGFNFVKPQKTIGKMRTFYGNFSVILKAYIYTLVLGKEGLKKTSETAILNANYILHKLKDFINVPHPENCFHEFVASGEQFKKQGIHTLDIAKRLIDYGYHPPTIYFPHIVKESMMIEPTETENLETLNQFIEDMKKIIKEIDENPNLLKQAPVKSPVRRVDEAKAARDMLKK